MIPKASVLWIDDEVRSDDASVQFLRSEGFSVVAAGSARHGIECAAFTQFDIVLLDLRLPDICGLEIIPELRRITGGASIAILTGFASLDTAVEAAKLGASRVFSKPLIGEELLRVVAALRQGEVRAHVSEDLAGPASSHSVINVLIRACKSLQPRETALRILATALTDPTLSAFGFGAHAMAFRSIATSDGSGCMDEVERLSERLDQAQTGLGRRVNTILASLDSERTFATAREIASLAELSPGRMTRELQAVSGRTFRTWRTLLRVRLAITSVASSGEQIAQIAYQCGYEHLSQFDRDFAKCFGLSPRMFRRLLHGEIRPVR